MIIGLTGYAQSGKDTVAQILVDRFGFKRIAFADKIRELLYEMDPPIKIHPDGGLVGLQNFVDIYGWDEAKQEPQVRQHLQNLGVAARKVFDESFWIYQALGEVAPQDKVVVSDVRFSNEADWIKDFDGQIWRVTRPGIDAVNNHVSETNMDNYKEDVHLINAGTLDELVLLVQTRMDSLLDAN